jgi:serine/threonine-protein kinase HipA
MSVLVALLEGREVGVIRQTGGRLSFSYDDPWRTAPGAYPLSLSLPLAAKDHGHAAINAFLWGLLPDNELILDRWAKRFHVSARSPFALIGKVGEDCAGAVQFVTPDQRDSWQNRSRDDVQWLTEADVADRLRGLQTDVAAWRAPRDTGQFSLAGAQPKTALLFDGRRWGVPSGRIPTTHILKPPTSELDGHVENEHICLALARAMGLPAVSSEVRDFGGVKAIVVERYDRVDISGLAAATAGRAAAKAAEAAMHAASAASGSSESAALAALAAAEAAEAAASAKSLSEFADTTKVYRVHQEDFCQALGKLPSNKYQSEGGPGPPAIVALLRASAFGGEIDHKRGGKSAADEDAATFVDALIFNWLIGGTDGHAKNYSILLGAGGLVRLAPLYDVASILGYPRIDAEKARLAMKIGGEHWLRDIGPVQWRKCAAELRMDAGVVIERARAMADSLPDLLSTEIARAEASGLSHPILRRLCDVLSARARTFPGASRRISRARINRPVSLRRYHSV